ncbi:MAG TPA: ABC transporter ATP-binding protein [Solirubrobacterales bacterium]|nr:ABC transporter ATP-binding protein [Solirubrobacterales bacterium]
MTALLDAQGMTVSYGGVHANADIDLAVGAGEFVGLIGANGAGKTTFIDAITGFTSIDAGHVHFDGEDISSLSPAARARRGLVRTFQSLELFDDLTVRDNLRVACERPRWARGAGGVDGKAAADERVAWALATVGLEGFADKRPEELPHGQRKLVGVARALAAEPKLVLLDEPAAGLDADESAELAAKLQALPAQGISLLLIDHDMSLVLSVCELVYVLDFGRMIATGTPAEIRGNENVITAYLGDSRAAEPTEPAAAEEPPG